MPSPHGKIALRRPLLMLILSAAWNVGTGTHAIGQHQTGDSPDMNVRGNVHVLRIYAAQIDGAPGDSTPIEVQEFDRRHRIVFWSRMVSGVDAGSRVETYSRYDRNGKVSVQEEFDRTYPRSRFKRYRYDRIGRLRQVRIYDDRGGRMLSEIIEYAYGRDTLISAMTDRLFGSRHYPKHGYVVARTEYVRDERGRILEGLEYGNGAILRSRLVQIYTGDRPVEKQMYEEGRYAVGEVRSYDTVGRTVSVVEIGGACDTTARTEIAYDRLGRATVERTYDDRKALIRETMFEYDEAGNVVAETQSRPQASSSRKLRYEYTLY